jgi:uncharacterized protein YkwD
MPRRLIAILASALVALPLLGSVPAAAADGPSIAELDSAEARVEALINRRRESRGLRPFRHDSRVADLARAKSQDMIDRGYFDHRDRQGHYVDYHLDHAGIRYSQVGEIIAYGHGGDVIPSAAEAVDLWMHSAPHRRLIVGGTNYFGAGVSTNGRVWKWTVIFITARDHTDPRASFSSTQVDGQVVDLRWSGSDPRLVTGTAGLRGFDLERRVPGGAWKRIRNATRNRTYEREYSPGMTFEFRLRARDNAGNIGRWTEPVSLTTQ